MRSWDRCSSIFILDEEGYCFYSQINLRKCSSKNLSVFTCLNDQTFNGKLFWTWQAWVTMNCCCTKMTSMCTPQKFSLKKKIQWVNNGRHFILGLMKLLKTLKSNPHGHGKKATLLLSLIGLQTWRWILVHIITISKYHFRNLNAAVSCGLSKSAKHFLLHLGLPLCGSRNFPWLKSLLFESISPSVWSCTHQNTYTRN